MPSQGDLYVVQKTQVNREQDSLRPGAVLPLKGDQNTYEPISNDSAKKEEQIPRKKRTLKSLRDFPYESIYYSWYRNDRTSIFRDILTKFDVKNNIDHFVKTLFTAAEIIRHLHQGSNHLPWYYHEYCKDNPNGPRLTLEQFDDYLYIGL